jgi:hypothetical protein
MSGYNQGFNKMGAGSGGGGGVDSNLSNTDLTANTISRVYKVAEGGALKFQTKEGVTILLVNDNGNVVIGGASPYTPPKSRGLEGDILQATNGIGEVSWVKRTEEVKLQAYNTNIPANNLNWFYASPMTNSNYMSLLDVDLGSNDNTTPLTGESVIRGGYYVVPRNCEAKNLVGWLSTETTLNCEISIMAFTPVNNDSGNQTGVEIVKGSSVGGGNNNSLMSLAGTYSAVELQAGDILIPMIRIVSGAFETPQSLVFNITLTLG